MFAAISFVRPFLLRVTTLLLACIKLHVLRHAGSPTIKEILKKFEIFGGHRLNFYVWPLRALLAFHRQKKVERLRVTGDRPFGKAPVCRLAHCRFCSFTLTLIVRSRASRAIDEALRTPFGRPCGLPLCPG